MPLKELLCLMKNAFFVITAGVVLAAGTFCSVFARDAHFGIEIFWQVLLLAVLTTLPFFIFYSKKELGKKAWIARVAIHGTVLVAIILCCGVLWDWIEVTNIAQLAFYIALIAVVYALVLLFALQRDKKTARALNSGLEKYNKEQKKRG